MNVIVIKVERLCHHTKDETIKLTEILYVYVHIQVVELRCCDD